ncbi:uncharacterized protein LOC116162208 [Photinus pyralis]|uniref:uncharacterized protein LOC116162208 n=1 Tax=Photinus pyralis TaxID=7054 RepID=UPI0012672811|nr:uncharacterized protein LOC116162208 [Photinus pyralis]
MKSFVAILFAAVLFSTARAEDRSLQGRDAISDATAALLNVVKACALDKIPPLIEKGDGVLFGVLSLLFGCGLPGIFKPVSDVVKCILTKLGGVLSDVTSTLLLAVIPIVAVEDVVNCVKTSSTGVCTAFRAALGSVPVLGDLLKALLVFCPQ